MDWHDKAIKLRFDDALSWAQIAEQMQEYFPDLDRKQVLEKVRGYLRQTKQYKAVSIPAKASGKLQYKFDYPYVNVYIIGDVHTGARGFQRKYFLRYIQQIMNDPYAVVIIVGDLIDNATIGSKGCPYRQTMTPQKQKESIIEMLHPIREKIIAVVKGNHCERSYKQTGNDIMYDICSGLKVLDKYCGVKAEITISVGQAKYNIYATHNLGKGEAKLRKMATSFSDVDLFIGGHIHTPKHITVAQKQSGGKQRDIEVVICNAWLLDEDYAVSAAYEPVSLKPSKAMLHKDHKQIDVIG